jgi:hypothetical protein
LHSLPQPAAPNEADAMMHALKQKINDINTLAEPINQTEMAAGMDALQSKLFFSFRELQQSSSLFIF